MRRGEVDDHLDQCGGSGRRTDQVPQADHVRLLRLLISSRGEPSIRLHVCQLELAQPVAVMEVKSGKPGLSTVRVASAGHVVCGVSGSARQAPTRTPIPGLLRAAHRTEVRASRRGAHASTAVRTALPCTYAEGGVRE